VLLYNRYFSQALAHNEPDFFPIAAAAGGAYDVARNPVPAAALMFAEPAGYHHAVLLLLVVVPMMLL
jgi:hypothetical protein